MPRISCDSFGFGVGGLGWRCSRWPQGIRLCIQAVVGRIGKAVVVGYDLVVVWVVEDQGAPRISTVMLCVCTGTAEGLKSLRELRQARTFNVLDISELMVAIFKLRLS